MDILIEFIVDVVFDFVVEIGKNHKLSKWIRYPILLFIFLFILLAAALFIYFGIFVFKIHWLLGLAIILFGIWIFIKSFLEFKKVYLEYDNQFDL